MTELEGTVVNGPCGAPAASCRCVLLLGHTGPHECDPVACGGSWDGDFEAGTATIIRVPFFRVGPADFGLAQP